MCVVWQLYYIYMALYICFLLKIFIGYMYPTESYQECKNMLVQPLRLSPVVRGSHL